MNMNHRRDTFGGSSSPIFPTIAFLALACLPLQAASIIQDFYVPLPEAQIYQANNAIVTGTGSTIFSTISIHVVYDGTVIYYDQWEDGYETDLGNPTKPTTQIWGDGNDAHGIPPGMAHNPPGPARRHDHHSDQRRGDPTPQSRRSSSMMAATTLAQQNLLW